MSIYIGLDTSNYTTSVALADGGEIVQNLRMALPVSLGQRGLKQSDALFLHTKQLPEVFERLGAVKPAAVGYSARPRDEDGSYMPCFLAGECVARAIASSFGIPAYPFSHQAGHIRAAIYSCGCLDLLNRDFLAFHVSGGTTELLHVSRGEIVRLGGTLDLNAGQVIDRVGVKAGLNFPCGRELECLAKDFPLPENTGSGAVGCDCNLSGLENIAWKMVQDGMEIGEIAAFVFGYIAATLKSMLNHAVKNNEAVNSAIKTEEIPVLFAGGVMANKKMRAYLSQGLDACFAEPEYSSDNAAGVALLCRDKHEGLNE